MTLTWLDHLINKGLDLLMFLLIPLAVWLFRYRIKTWFKGNNSVKEVKKDG